MAHFKRYIEITAGTAEDITVPLLALSPMGRVHVPEALDTLSEARCRCQTGV